ncbi:MAG: DUF4837 domain-containing protein [Bacteroidetes bacterium HGW-Bacteroidetes-13]|nr:MAG: DUF4837 domain-containing protein [Bacteroidetes bacterium HGW-Bacteroidetes-13]
MKKFFLFFVVITFIISCDKKTDKDSNQKILPDSNGRISTLNVVLDNNLWEGAVGNAIRDSLAKPTEGLPQDEPVFNISHLPPKTFSGFTTKGRNILIAQLGNDNQFSMQENVYAKPQKVVFVVGKTESDLIGLIRENSEKIIENFKSGDVVETIRRINKSLLGDEGLKDSLRISLPIPTAYRFAAKTKSFFWIRKTIQEGHMNIVAYELPYRDFSDEQAVLNFVIKTRDSIGKERIPGPAEGSYLITEEAYSPFIKKDMVDGRKCWETKGTWEVKGDFMAGPYVSYLIDDKANKRLVVLEGFVFAPSALKRDNVFELESILRSVKFL